MSASTPVSDKFEYSHYLFAGSSMDIKGRIKLHVAHFWS